MAGTAGSDEQLLAITHHYCMPSLRLADSHQFFDTQSIRLRQRKAVNVDEYVINRFSLSNAHDLDVGAA